MRLAPIDIVDAAALDEQIPTSLIFTRSRKSPVARARQVAMYLCRNLSGMSFPRIGLFFERDHSTVHHDYAVVAARIRNDEAFRSKVSRIQERAHQIAEKEAAEEVAA
jgi:chromosomal replication initiator protein